jgi:hypothetical protein
VGWQRRALVELQWRLHGSCLLCHSPHIIAIISADNNLSLEIDEQNGADHDATSTRSGASRPTDAAGAH